MREVSERLSEPAHKITIGFTMLMDRQERRPRGRTMWRLAALGRPPRWAALSRAAQRVRGRAMSGAAIPQYCCSSSADRLRHSRAASGPLQRSGKATRQARSARRNARSRCWRAGGSTRRFGAAALHAKWLARGARTRTCLTRPLSRQACRRKYWFLDGKCGKTKLAAGPLFDAARQWRGGLASRRPIGNSRCPGSACVLVGSTSPQAT